MIVDNHGMRVLSFDNGGTRGLSQLLILQEFMTRLEVMDGCETDPLPAGYFDFICGTGIGGLFAMLLGTLGFSVGQTIDTYRRLILLFSDTTTLAKEAQKLEMLLSSIYEESTHSTGDMSHTTKVIISVPNAQNDKSLLLRNYCPDSGEPAELGFVETCLTACFTPGSLSPNPIYDILSEIGASFPYQAVACLVSLGAGVAPETSMPPQTWMFCFASPKKQNKTSVTTSQMAVIAEGTAESVAVRLSENKMTGVYFRFSVTQGLQDILIETEDNLGQVSSHTKQYLQTATNSREVNKVVEAILSGRPSISPYSGGDSDETITLVQSEDSLQGHNLESILERVRYTSSGGSVVKFSALIRKYHDKRIDISGFISLSIPLLYGQPDMMQIANSILPTGYSLVTPLAPNHEKIIISIEPGCARIHLQNGDFTSLLDVSNTFELRHALADQNLWKQFQDLDSPWADCLVQLLQTELDVVETFDSRDQFLQLLRHYGKTENILPPSFFLSDLHCDGTNPVSGGGFADIWKGQWCETPVCLKVLRIFSSDLIRENTFKDFSNEALLWRQIKHPNVLPFLGVSINMFFPSFCLVSPFMEHGNVLEFMRTNPDFNKLQGIKDVASGLCALHSFEPQIIHGDIRGANILVKNDLSLCIADFGLATLSEYQTLDIKTSAGSRGATRWLAPELLAPGLFSDSPGMKTSRDVYAFGCMILELVTGEVPFAELIVDAAVILNVTQGARPKRPPLDCPDFLWDIVTQCWAQESSQRPSMSTVSHELEQ